MNDLAITSQIPWVWYLSRGSGFLAFGFLWLTMFLGLSIRNKFLQKWIKPFYSFDLHCFLAASCVFWALFHGLSFAFHDPVRRLSFQDIFIPWLSGANFVDVNFLGLGIAAFYLLVILTLTSYLKKFIGWATWRAFHYFNPFAFVFAVLHGYLIGTDMKNIWVKASFFALVGALIFVFVSNFLFWLGEKFSNR